MLVTMAGWNKTLEPKQMVLYTNARPNLAVCHTNAITDVRVAVISLTGFCPGVAATPGHAALLSEAEEDAKWMRQAVARGVAFRALISEDCRRLGVGVVRFVDFLASREGSSAGERQVFVSFALQRLRCATVKGACALINECLPSSGYSGRSCRGLMPLSEPKGRPGASRPQYVPRTREGLCHHGTPRHFRPCHRRHHKQWQLETYPCPTHFMTLAFPPAS